MSLTVEKKPPKSGHLRRLIFRCIRLVLAAGLLGGVAYFAWHAFTVVSSDQAYLHAEIVTMRSPIAGTLHMEKLVPGSAVAAGTPLFRVENMRFGNTPVAAQLSSARDLCARLVCEIAESEARREKLAQLVKHDVTLKAEKLLAPVQLIENEMKLSIAQATLKNTKAQLVAAEAHEREMEEQLALQKETRVNMPWDGVVWSVNSREGEEIEPHDMIVQLLNPQKLWVEVFLPERHARKFHAGMRVRFRMLDDERMLDGHVESIRAGVGKLPYEDFIAVQPGEFMKRRVAVRVRVDAEGAFPPEEFYGVGRSVTLQLDPDE